MLVEFEPLALSAGPYLDLQCEGGARLIGSECGDCGHRLFPTAAVCPNCMSENMTRLPLSRDGRVYSFTVLRQAPPGFESPSIIAYVDMPEGVRIVTHLDMQPGEPHCDMPVRLKPVAPKTDKLGRKVVQFKFAAVENA